MALRDELTLNNVRSYAAGCVDVAHHLSTLNAEGRTTIVLPSRGAFPIYKTADHVREYLGYAGHEWLVLPFTADPAQDVEPATTRRHWVKVLGAESTGVVNRHWSFFQKFLADIGGTPSKEPRNFGKFVMIDTAISGRAAAEIVTALNEEALDYHLLLVVDASGDKLRPEYKRVLEATGRVTLVPVAALYTEDRGCALMGITTAMFPARTADECVASLWLALNFKAPFWDASAPKRILRNASQFFGCLHAMHFYATKLLVDKEFETDGLIPVEHFRALLLEHVSLVGKESTLAACSQLERLGRLEVTSSMALRVT